MRPGRLFWKFFFAFWLALLVAGAAVGTAVWLHREALERERAEDGRLQGVAAGPRADMAVAAAASVLTHGGDEALRRLLVEWSGERAPRVLVVDQAGRDLLGREVAPAALAEARAWRDDDGHRQPVRQVSGPDGRRWVLFVPARAGEGPWERHPPPGGGGGRPPPGRHGPTPPDPWIPIGGGLLASVLFSALLAWHLSKPIHSLRWALGSVAAGNLETRVRPLMGSRRDEIADLGEDFDRMARQLQSLIVSQRRLLHDVSHELRSPLARLQAAIGLLRQDPARLTASLERIEREAGRLDDLVGQLLTMARLEAGVRDAPKARIELFDLAASIAEDARFEAQSLGRDLQFHGDGEAEATLRVELIQRAFENVMRNAVKYTLEGSCVQVVALREGDVFVLRVDDAGPGVPTADLEAIFEPFYRCGAGQGADGFGLGLAIARRAVDLHGGSLRAVNRPEGGLSMEIRLPLGGAAQKE